MQFTYSTDVLERLEKHLPETSDIELIVLKGHLLVEERINTLLEEELPNARALTRGRFTFFHRMLILDSLISWSMYEIRDDALNVVEKLNTLRNRLAHHLEPSDLNRHVREFLDAAGAYGKDLEQPAEEAIPELLREAITGTLSFLVGIGVMLTGRRLSQGTTHTNPPLEDGSRRVV